LYKKILKNSENLIINENKFQNELCEVLLNANIKIKLKLSNDELFSANIFFKIFNFYPKAIIIFNDVIIFMVYSNEFHQISTKLKENIKKIQKAFQNKYIYIKIYPISLKDLIFSLFSHINSEDILSISIKFSSDEIKEIIMNHILSKDLNSSVSILTKIDLYIYLEIFDNSMPLALGKNGNFIHCVNHLLKLVTFEHNFLNSIIKHIQLFLHSKI